MGYVSSQEGTVDVGPKHHELPRTSMIMVSLIENNVLWRNENRTKVGDSNGSRTLLGSIIMSTYYWWKKSCITWDVEIFVNNGINYWTTSTGARFHQQYQLNQWVCPWKSTFEWFFRNDYFSSKGLYSTIPGVYSFHGLWLPGKSFKKLKFTFLLFDPPNIGALTTGNDARQLPKLTEPKQDFSYGIFGKFESENNKKSRHKICVCTNTYIYIMFRSRSSKSLN